MRTPDREKSLKRASGDTLHPIRTAASTEIQGAPRITTETETTTMTAARTTTVKAVQI